MQRIIFVIVFLSCCRLNAQMLIGRVYDKDTKQPISNVYVYLDRTTINAITDNSGTFQLYIKQAINTKLILRHVSYSTIIIEYPFEIIPELFFMEAQVNILDEIVIQSDQFSHEQKLKAFKEQFLGSSQAGKSCEILNEGDIQFWYNTHAQILFAYSE